MKIALVHDFLVRFGGAERVLLSLHKLFPEAPIYTLLYEPSKMEPYFSDAEVRTSFLDKYPGFLKRKYRYLLPLFPTAIESFNLRDFDLVISSSDAFSKGIIVRPKTLHIAYLHSPMRFAWDWNQEYLGEQRKGKILTGIMKILVHYLRIWDRNAAQRPDFLIANSQYTAQRIKKYYQREAKIIYPPVKTSGASLRKAFHSDMPEVKDNYFLIISHLSPYKKIDIAIEAFNKLEFPLIIIGEGPERKRLQKIAKSNIKFLGWQSEEIKNQYLKNCLALIFPGEDDFGITMVEAASFGKPVLALRQGGANEIIIEGETGEFFDEPDVVVLADGVRRLKENLKKYNPKKIKLQAQKFSQERFEKEIKQFIDSKFSF